MSKTAFLDRVAFETLPVPTNGNDVFELESDGGSNSTSAGVVVTIRGSSSVALATGLGWYLRYYCKAYPASWDNRRVNGQATGRQLGTVDPARLPRVWPKLRRHSAVRWRYCEYRPAAGTCTEIDARTLTCLLILTYPHIDHTQT